MKILLSLAFFAFITFSAKSQRASFENDTAKYNGMAYAVSDTINLGYGSQANKNFAFIQIGSMMTGVTDLDKGWSKAEAIIDKIYKKGKTVFFRAKLIDKTVNAIGGNKLFIDLEGAIDNKELK